MISDDTQRPRVAQLAPEVTADEQMYAGALTDEERFRLDTATADPRLIAAELGTLADPTTSHCHVCGTLAHLHRLELTVIESEPVLTVKLVHLSGQGCRAGLPSPFAPSEYDQDAQAALRRFNLSAERAANPLLREDVTVAAWRRYVTGGEQ